MKNKKNDTIREHKLLRYVLTVCFAMLLGILLKPGSAERVQAAVPELYFEDSRYSQAVGNTRRIILYFGDEKVDPRSDAFKWHGGFFENSDENVVYLDEKGYITCVGAGNAVITAHFQGVTAQVKIKVKDNKFSISEDNLILYQGEKKTVKLSGPGKAYGYEYCTWKNVQQDNDEDPDNDEDQKVKLVPSGENNTACSVSCSSKGKFTIVAENEGTDYIDLIRNSKNGESYSKRCTVEVLPCGLTEHELTVEAGKKAKLPLLNAEFVSAQTDYGCDGDEEWTSELPISIRGASGVVKGVEASGADYLITYSTPSGTLLTDIVRIIITSPETDSDEDADGEDEDTEELTSDLSQKTVFLVKGKSKQLKIKDLPDDSKVKYESSDSSVVKVSKKGKLTAKGYGSAIVTVTAAPKKYYIAVNVGTQVCIDAIKWGLGWVGKAQYSQARRMDDGYFDCSSFTWRSFNAAGFHLADSSVAPPSADIGQWMANNGYAIEFGAPDFTELRPGDLIFSTTGSNNGRYLKIDHVAIYYGVDLVDSGSESWLINPDGKKLDSDVMMVGRIVHAGSWGGGIYISDYSGYGSGNIVLTARPIPED